MRIAIFTPGVLPVPPSKGGAVENLVQMLVEENEKRQLVSFTITSIHDEAAVKDSSGYRYSNFYFVKMPRFVLVLDSILHQIMRYVLPTKATSFRTIFSRLWYIKKSKDFFLQHNFDYIVAENHPSLFLAMKDRKMKKLYGAKFLYHAHNEPNGSFGCRKQIVQCPRILTVSNFISDSWRAKYPKGSSEYVFIPNGIDTTTFSQKLSTIERNFLLKKLNLTNTDFVIIFAGRLVEGKGILQLARVFARLPIKEKKLLVVGSAFFGTTAKTPIQTELERILSSCRESVVFTGYIPYQEIWKYYQIATVAGFVPIWNEPGALTNIEAQASSLPVVTTISGGIPEYSNQESQILLAIDDDLEQNLHQKLMELYHNPQMRDSIGKKNAEFAQQFSKENFYNNFIHSLQNPSRSHP